MVDNGDGVCQDGSILTRSLVGRVFLFLSYPDPGRSGPQVNRPGELGHRGAVRSG